MIENSKEILFVILGEFADWESAPLAAAINAKDGYCVKTVSLTKAPVVSIGGFTVLPDYDLAQAMTVDFFGLVLIGGNQWRTDEAKAVTGLVDLAVSKNVVVAGICDGSVFLGACGTLNDIPHTSNQLEDLQNFAGEKYTGALNYKKQQAVRSAKFVTANGTAALEFAREALLALGIMAGEESMQWYRLYKLGYFETMPPQ